MAPGAPDDTPAIAPGEHPARRFAVVVVLMVLTATAILFLRPGDRGAEASLAPYLGESARLVIHTEPGAAPDDLESFEDVTLLEIGDHDGERALRIGLAMQPVGPTTGAAELWIPLHRVAAVWIGPLRVYWSPERENR